MTRTHGPRHPRHEAGSAKPAFAKAHIPPPTAKKRMPLQPAPRPVLDMLAEYEECLAQVQRAHRGVSARLPGADATYRQALDRARLLGARVRNAMAAA